MADNNPVAAAAIPQGWQRLVQAEGATVFDASRDGMSQPPALTANDTQVRNASNPEPAGTAGAVNGLRPGHTGTGYVDMGAATGSAGDKVTFDVAVPQAGTYTLHFRYANGGDTNRPLLLSTNGTATGTLPFAKSWPAGTTAAQRFNQWAVQTVEVQLQAGSNTIALAIGSASLNGPNIDALAITAPGAAPNFTAPVSLSGSDIVENAAGAVVGTLAPATPGSAFTTADPRFVIEGNELRLAPGVALDHEAASSVTVAITTTPPGGAPVTSNIVVVVANVNEAPVLKADAAVADIALEQGETAAVDIAAALGATDPEGTAVTYTLRLAGGGEVPAGITLSNGTLSVAGTVAPGTYALEVLASDGTLTSAPVGFDVTVAGAAPEFTPVVVQAESGTLTPGPVNTNSTTTRNVTAAAPEPDGTLRPGFSGTGYLDWGDDPGDTVTYTITVAEAGTYDLNIRYASQTAAGQQNRTLNLVVNGGAAELTGFPPTGTNANDATAGFMNWAFLTKAITLQAGTNTISFSIPAGRTNGPNFDRIEITEAGTGPLVPDTSADEDGNLALTGPNGALSEEQASAIPFTLAGIDRDIVKVEISIDGGPKTVVQPNANGSFTFDGSALPPGSHGVTLTVTDEVGNTASSSTSILIDGDAPGGFEVTLEAETFTITDTDGDSTRRDATIREPGANAGNSGPGLEYTAGGLRPGYEGSGYLDLGNDIGDRASFSVTVPDAGSYEMTVRYANGGAADRPMAISVGGVVQTLSFPPTGGWANWAEVTVKLPLAAGTNAISLANTVTNAPNLDNVTITQDEIPTEREQIYFEQVAKINFQPAGFQTPAGYLADTGAAFGARGNGQSYGWVTEASVADGTANGTIAAAQPSGAHSVRNTPGASDLQKTYARFENTAAGPDSARAWEMALENGTYLVKVSIGDTGGPFDSTYALNIEGQAAMPNWTPGTANGGTYQSNVITKAVTVTDGRLTLDSIGGINTEIQWLEVERIEDLTPTDNRPADADYSYFIAPIADSLEGGEVSIALGPNGQLPTGVDPTSVFAVGVALQGEGYRGPNIAYTDGVKLVETLTGIEVPVAIQISGGADTLNVRPIDPLKPFTSYTLKIENVLDLGNLADENAPLRQMQDLTTSFVTGEMPALEPKEVAFNTSTQLNGFADGAGGYTSVEFGPDGKLYVATITGEIHRWIVNADGSIDKSSKESLVLDYFAAPEGERRGIVGFTFDPEDPSTIWITDNAPIPREAKAFDTPEFSGRVSKITLGEAQSFSTATIETYLTGLPRSGGDHVTNSLEFRANPDAGKAGEPNYLLYLSQGSNTATGGIDTAWGGRPERLLNATVLEIDHTRDAPDGGFSVQTEPSDPEDPTFRANEDGFNDDGTYPGFYNPYASDAVARIFATGIRNAYDLVWHSNGNLYLPTNGSGALGNTPTDPNQPGLDTEVTGAPLQPDYLFNVKEGKYYGHPNTLRGEYILNGGNPTGGLDPNEVAPVTEGSVSYDGYVPGVLPDPDYDLGGTYNLGDSRSPNGAIEYRGNAFGPALKGALIFAQFSRGDNLRMIQLDESGKIIGDDVLRRPNGEVINNYIDPLDIIENPITGQLYLMTLNRATGASQIVLLTPVPGNVITDTTADEGGDLALVAVDLTDPAAAVFQVNGLDADITALRVAFNGQPEITVTVDAQKRFTANLAALPAGATTAVLTVIDDAQNTASKSLSFNLGAPPEFQTLVTIQAEDRTPGDGTSVTIPTTGGQIVIRDASNPEPTTQPGMTNGLWNGAYGTDGNTNGNDGIPGGYADFGSTNNDFLTFTFDAEDAGSALLRFRYSNGSGNRPLSVEVNGTVIGTQAFASTGSFGTWAVIEVPANLIAGVNKVTLRSTANTGPNIDQLEVLVPNAPTEEPEEPQAPNDGTETVNGVTFTKYEAENAVSTGAPATGSGRNQSGTGFIDFLGPDTETLTWTVSVAEAGDYSIDVIYALSTSKAPRPMGLAVNGASVGTLAFAGNSNANESVWGPQPAVVTLPAGTSTITITAPGGVAPNVDYLRVSQEPINAAGDPAAIDGSGRIELETTDGSADVVGPTMSDFFFTVAEDGLYKLDTAANAGAPNGGTLGWYLNGVQVGSTGFPTAGETSVFTELKAGTEYQLRLISSAPGANALDYLDIAQQAGDGGKLAIQSLDPAFFDDRLHFSWLENAVMPGQANRDMKDEGTVRISNSGTEPLAILSATLGGPFKLANPGALQGLTLAPGASLDVEVLFDRTKYTPPTSNIDATSTVFNGKLKLVTNGAEPFAEVNLSGFWQSKWESGMEPNLNEVWQIFGFGNRIEGLSLRGGGENSTMSTKDVFAQTDETEVLSPYWKIADGYSSAKITQIAALHGPGGAQLGIHNPGNKNSHTVFSTHQGTDNQRLLPNGSTDANFATKTFTRADIPDGWQGTELFGIRVDGLSSDPRLNPRGGVEVPGAQQGHTVKLFQALDAAGNVIPNVFLGAMDYTGINYDYNDNLFVIEGVTPVGFGNSIAVSGLDDAAADARLVFTSIDQPVSNQQFRNEATFTITNDGIGALAIAGLDVTGAFQIVGTPPTSLAAGASAQITVRFTGTHAGTGAGADLHEGSLTIRSGAFGPPRVIQLSGLAQEFSERDSEPTAAQIVEAFGYATDIAQGDLANGGKVETIGDEVLMPYLAKLDATKAVEVIQIGAFLTQGNVARLGYHSLGSANTTNLFANDDQQGQTVLPDGLKAGAGDSGSVARGTVPGTAPFGLHITVDGRPTYASWTDPKANDLDPNFGNLVSPTQGHLIRFFEAKGADGKVIPGTYIALQDYPGAGNYDYNDHMFIVKNVKPHVLTAAEDANGDRINDALQLDKDGDGLVDFFDTQVAYGGTAPSFANGTLTVQAVNFDEGGNGIAHQDSTPGLDGGNTTFRPGRAVEVAGTDISYVKPGEWLEYTVNVPTAGNYALSVNARTPVAGATVAVSLENGTALGTVALADGNPSGNAFTTGTPFAASAPISIPLSAGEQTIRLTLNGPLASNGYVMDLRSFTLTAPAAPAAMAMMAMEDVSAPIFDDLFAAMDLGALPDPVDTPDIAPDPHPDLPGYDLHL
ncbi:CBM35 domain-containing protein [Cereibacter sp. SYSU M97828]|nr:CBM35 domain-containing protein [Cereibacter flavus]